VSGTAVSGTAESIVDVSVALSIAKPVSVVLPVSIAVPVSPLGDVSKGVPVSAGEVPLVQPATRATARKRVDTVRMARM